MQPAKEAQKPTISEEIRRLIAVRTPIVYLITFEEERAERMLGQLAQKAFSQSVPFFRWTLSEGLRANDGVALEGTEDPVSALDVVIKQSGAALFLFHGLQRTLADPRVARRLRDVYRALRSNYKTLFIVAPTLELPRECEKDVVVLDLPLPGVSEIERVFDEVCEAQKNLKLELAEERDALLRGALGLTENEAHAAFTKLLLGRTRAGPEIIDALYEEKRGIVRKEGILDHVVLSALYTAFHESARCLTSISIGPSAAWVRPRQRCPSGSREHALGRHARGQGKRQTHGDRARHRILISPHSPRRPPRFAPVSPMAPPRSVRKTGQRSGPKTSALDRALLFCV